MPHSYFFRFFVRTPFCCALIYTMGLKPLPLWAWVSRLKPDYRKPFHETRYS